MGIKKNLKRGFTLVELMIVVAIIGILAALAIYGVRRYVTNAKTSEARNSLGGVAKSATMAYDRETMDGTLLSSGASSAFANALCGSGDAVPAATASIQGKKYQSSPSEWDGDATTGWRCLMFQMEAPQYFQYEYVADGTDRVARGTVGTTFTAVAHGDLDGDGTTSQFALQGELREEGGNKTVAVSPSIAETDADE